MTIIEQTKTIVLSKPLKKAGVIYRQIELKEPDLSEVEQFYEAKQTKSSLPAMKLLISLNSGISEKTLNSMAYTDYKKCENYLMAFLNFESRRNGSS